MTLPGGISTTGPSSASWEMQRQEKAVLSTNGPTVSQQNSKIPHRTAGTLGCITQVPCNHRSNEHAVLR